MNNESHDIRINLFGEGNADFAEVLIDSGKDRLREMNLEMMDGLLCLPTLQCFKVILIKASYFGIPTPVRKVILSTSRSARVPFRLPKL